MALTAGDLETLGFNEKKARVYLTCLERSGSAADIAQRAKLKRSTVYGYLEELISDQLISRSVSGKRSFFTAESPEQLIYLQEMQRMSLKSLMPELRSIFQQAQTSRPPIRYLEGIDGIRKIHEELISKSGSEYFYFGGMKSFAAALGQEYLSDITRRRIRRRVWSNALRIRNDETNERDSFGNEENLRRVRYLPASIFPHTSSITLHEQKAIIISDQPHNHVFIIEDAGLCATLKIVWDFCWSAAKE